MGCSRAGTTHRSALARGRACVYQANLMGVFRMAGLTPAGNGAAPALGGSYAPTPGGLYDMHGKLWECEDCMGPYRAANVIVRKSPHRLRPVLGAAASPLGQGCGPPRCQRSPTL